MFKNEEGFSLLELVVAVGVAGIIAAVALPTFAGIQAHATSTSATYAASASAAEALANSTIGNTGSTNSNGGSSYYSSSSSSNTGGASSNPSIATVVNLVANDLCVTDASLNSFFGGNCISLQESGNPIHPYTLKLDGLTWDSMTRITSALNNNGATTVFINGVTYSAGDVFNAGINSWYGTYYVEIQIDNILAAPFTMGIYAVQHIAYGYAVEIK